MEVSSKAPNALHLSLARVVEASSAYAEAGEKIRLLNVHTLILEDFTGKQILPYCILSHRWGDEEVSCTEFRKDFERDSACYRKILNFCALIRLRNNLGLNWLPGGAKKWVWIDKLLVCPYALSTRRMVHLINSDSLLEYT
jgi:hypothetical protein